MSIRKFNQASLDAWVTSLVEKHNIYGVQAKGDKFAFGPLTNAQDLRLDYDVTVLPPKKYFQPQREHILEYNIKNEYKSLVETDPFILFGVHPYDVVAISQMDKIFSADNYDVHYMNRRNAATIVACDVQTAHCNSFAGYMNTATVKEGFDILLTKIEDGYIGEAITEKGKALLAEIPNAQEPNHQDLCKRNHVWHENTMMLRKQKLKCSIKDIPAVLEQSYNDPIWEERTKHCFSCGSCNLVCPTCYCFDIQDDLNWDLQTGKRTRAWDGCLLTDFAAVAGGHNFRQHRADRYRHRYYRKGKYIANKLNQLACVGCGRCITACVPGIANPVEVYNALHDHCKNDYVPDDTVFEEDQVEVTPTGEKNIYTPEPAKLLRVEEMTATENFYELALASGAELGHQPGQFLEISLPGLGEAPISISSSPTQKGIFQMVVRKVGNVTKGLAKLKPGDTVGVRGPFGSQFPVHDEMIEKDLLFVCGGIGLVPVRSAINYILDHREDYGHLTILLGARTPSDRLFLDEVTKWKAMPDVTVLETVDMGDASWTGNTGVITTLLPKVDLNPDNTVAVICGPPIMYRFVLADLIKMGMSEDSIFVSLERRMKCGVGKCGHCQMNEIYVCQEGPVFKYSDIKEVMEAI